jgi:hypothetical protein
MKPTHLNCSSGRHLPLTLMPKSLTSKTRIEAIMRKHFRISRPNGGLAPHVAQGYWEGYVETFPYIQ